MQFKMKILAACVIAAGFATAAFADQPQDVVTGPGSSPVKGAKFGNCVITKWNAKDDICAPAAPKKMVAPAPAPQPVSKLAREQLTIYFGFNKDVLTPESKAKLDQIADAVNHSPKVVKVDIVGYTDKLGSNSYNDKLSVRRADAVKSYLDTRSHIPSDVVGLRGLGDKDPVTTGCEKLKKRKAKIACMARDRRTEIEFEFHQ
jgi:OOP family OmpA-OmpF porin